MNVRTWLGWMVLGLFVIALARGERSGVAFAQGERGAAQARFAGKRVAIDYGRPPLNGRDVLESLPPGMLWRMGMNQATTLTTEGALVFGDVEIPPGSYSLFLRRVDEDAFRLIFNAETGQWGLQYDPERDVASIPLRLARLDERVERFEIALITIDEAPALRLRWGDVSLSSSFGMKRE